MEAKGFKSLIVWQKSFELSKEIYQIVSLFPKEDKYSLGMQLKRAVVSVPSNIAEGYGRQYNKEFTKFLSIAYGSLCEVETQYLFAVEIGLVKEKAKISTLIVEVGKMLWKLQEQNKQRGK